MTLSQKIAAFLEHGPHAVVGASRDRDKYGNKVLRAYLQRQRAAYPVNPKVPEIEGLTAYPDLASSPEPVHGVSIVTPPAVTEHVVQQAAALGIRHIWIQPGGESPQAIQLAERLGLNLIAGGPCLLVVLGYREE